MKNVYAFFAAVLMTAIVTAPISTDKTSGFAPVFASDSSVVLA